MRKRDGEGRGDEVIPVIPKFAVNDKVKTKNHVSDDIPKNRIGTIVEISADGVCFVMFRETRQLYARERWFAPEQLKKA